MIIDLYDRDKCKTLVQTSNQITFTSLTPSRNDSRFIRRHKDDKSKTGMLVKSWTAFSLPVKHGTARAKQ